MTPEELAAKEKELRERAAELARRESELRAEPAAKGKSIETPPSPSPSTYATSIKLHVPITLDLAASNYTN
jgi:hypothetical protein